MRNKNKFLGIILTIAVIGFFTACGDDEPEQHTHEITGITTAAGTITVTVTGSLPSSTTGFESAIRDVLSSSTTTSNLTINIIAGNSGFTKTGSKTLSVGASWLAGKGYDAIVPGLMAVVTQWTAMNKTQNRVRYAGGSRRVPVTQVASVALRVTTLDVG